MDYKINEWIKANSWGPRWKRWWIVQQEEWMNVWVCLQTLWGRTEKQQSSQYTSHMMVNSTFCLTVELISKQLMLQHWESPPLLMKLSSPLHLPLIWPGQSYSTHKLLLLQLLRVIRTQPPDSVIHRLKAKDTDYLQQLSVSNAAHSV